MRISKRTVHYVGITRQHRINDQHRITTQTRTYPRATRSPTPANQHSHQSLPTRTISNFHPVKNISHSKKYPNPQILTAIHRRSLPTSRRRHRPPRALPTPPNTSSKAVLPSYPPETRLLLTPYLADRRRRPDKAPANPRWQPTTRFHPPAQEIPFWAGSAACSTARQRPNASRLPASGQTTPTTSEHNPYRPVLARCSEDSGPLPVTATN